MPTSFFLPCAYLQYIPSHWQLAKWNNISPTFPLIRPWRQASRATGVSRRTYPSLPVIPNVRIGIWTPVHTSWGSVFRGSFHTSSQGMTGGFWKTRVIFLVWDANKNPHFPLESRRGETSATFWGEGPVSEGPVITWPEFPGWKVRTRLVNHLD